MADLGHLIQRANNVHSIDPELHFPVGEVFEIPDEFNGRFRGTFYFRDPYSEKLRGPFLSQRIAQVTLNNSWDGY